MTQIYHPYWKWEDYLHGMWRKEPKPYNDEHLRAVIEFTGDHLAYGAAMARVVNEWRFACEHNLTNRGQNRKAWLGHAACCLQNGWPEYLVRSAWSYLTDEQRGLANAQAEYYIKSWENARQN